jgi:hypothetical protein
MNMRIHEKYGKALMKAVAGDGFVDSGDVVRVRYRGGISANIDGVLNGCCAVEIESRVEKQVRGAVIDLLCHPLAKKLLVLIPEHMNNPEGTAEMSREILDRFNREGERSEVVLLRGTGNYPKPDEDRRLIEQALKILGCLS